MKYSVFIAAILIAVLCVNVSNNASLNAGGKYEKFIGSQGLYAQKDDVEILAAANFKAAIMGSQRAWLVEFYNSWCGFCQRFAPSWKEFATNVRSWRDLVAVAAVDCNNEENYAICREFEIMAYPNLKYFHEGFTEGAENVGVTLTKGVTATEHKQVLLNKLMSEQLEGRGKHFPNLTAYNHTDVKRIFNGTPEAVRYAILIVQENGSYVGPEVLMDLHRSSGIVMRYAVLNEHIELYSHMKTYIIDRDYNIDTITQSQDRNELKNAIINHLKDKHILFRADAPSNDGQDGADNNEYKKHDELAERVKETDDAIYQMDLETVLRYSLKREVGGVKEISGEKLEALKKYLDILIKYFPFGKQGKIFLKSINEYVKTSSSVEGAHIFNTVKDAEKEPSQVFSTPQNWLGCRGSSPHYRGYPCGLWKMFHYLTVNAAQDPEQTNPKVALEAMHGYIKNYFGCFDCSQHFQEMATRRQINQVSSSDDSILWLWKAHNEVNKRLSGDISEDPEFPKIQFPLPEHCSQCHKKDGSWDSQEVLKYLKHMYSSINIKYLGADTRVILEGDGNSTDTGFFRTLDTKGLPSEDVSVQTRFTGEGVDAMKVGSGARMLVDIKDKALILVLMSFMLIGPLG